MVKFKVQKNEKTISRVPSKKLVLKKSNKKIATIRAEKKNLRLKKEPVKLQRVLHNPIISPRLYPWESKATFNPAAFISNGKVHIIYRAIGHDDTSSLGYATSKDGQHISERPTYFIYKRFMDVSHYDEPIFYDSGGGWSGGCEDPRLTKIGNMVYMLYTAFDGWGSVRIAMTSIKMADFTAKKWNWEKPVFISPPGEIHKNWVLFPEKIKGKFAILHSISPEVLIEYVDSMEEFDGTKFIRSYHGHSASQENSWDNWVRGVGPPPIKTDIGWLVLYHAMDNNDPDRYKLGVLVLNPKNPTEILYRSRNPILEPNEEYENEGWKYGVIYSCGAVVKDGELFVYYGGADKFVCVASIELKKLIDDLTQGKVITLKKDKLMKL